VGPGIPHPIGLGYIAGPILPGRLRAYPGRVVEPNLIPTGVLLVRGLPGGVADQDDGT
jgi:hypothetical protein